METNTRLRRNKRGLSLLSLDGGGIRGLSELIIIEELMQRLKAIEQLPKVPIPADRFDLIGGTSTGGLIAILLGRLRLPAADAIKAYEALAGKVFSKKKLKGQDGTFKASKLEEAIKEVVKDICHEDTDARMYEEAEGGPDRCRAFVCAVGTTDITHAAGPTLFRSYDVAKNREHNCTIWEAARATSAAPTFFKRIKIGPPGSGIEYVDAGMGYNNPVKEVIDEAARVFGEDAAIAGIVSIGTGQSGGVGLAKPDVFQKWLPTNLINALKEIATDSGRVAEEMERKYKYIPGLYNRLDVDRGLASVSLDEWKKLGDVRAYTKNYMRLEANNERVDTVVGILNGSFSHHTRTAGELVGSVQSNPDEMLRVMVPPPRVSHFVARPAVLAAISKHFLDQASNKVVVLLGMGGSGKTQLALEFCRQAEKDLGFMDLFWINASSPVSVIQSYKAVAKRLSKSQQDDANSEHVISLVQDNLRAWEQPWLFVFDNYDNPKAFQPHSIHYYIPKGKGRRILFTSRHKDSARLGHKVEVSDMTVSEGLEVLLQRPPKNDEESLQGKEIAAILGYLALALDQAGSYLRARKLRLRDFASSYQKCKEDILKTIPDEWEYQNVTSDQEKENRLNIFTTWELSFNQISGHEKEVQQKEHFLSLAAFFDITVISDRYFEAYFNEKQPDWMALMSSEGTWDIDKLGGVLAEFDKLSLIQTQEHAIDEQLFSIHPVVRDWIQLRKSREVRQRFAQELIITLRSYLKGIDSNELSLETNQETLLHIDSCVNLDKDLLSEASYRSLDDDWYAAYAFAEFYRRQGRYEEAVKLFEQALRHASKELGPSHKVTCITMENLASVYRQQGRFDEAEKLLNRILVEGEKTLGTKHPDMLSVANTLATVYYRQTRYNEAEQLYKKILNDKEERPGAMHLVTLGTASNLANVYSIKGQYKEAEKLYKQALTGSIKNLGPTHPDTLRAMHNLGQAYRDQRQYDKAEKFYERALTGKKEKLGATHPSTLRTVHCLGAVYQYQRRYDEAEKFYTQALTGRNEKLGVTHPDTLNTVHNLGSLYYDQRRYDEAEVFYKRALTGREEKLGVTHPGTLRTAGGLATLCRDQGQDDEAEVLAQKFGLTWSEEKSLDVSKEEASDVPEEESPDMPEKEHSGVSEEVSLVLLEGESPSMSRKSLQIRQRQSPQKSKVKGIDSMVHDAR